MSKKILFYKAILWNLIGLIMTTLLSYLWFSNWLQSLSFSLTTVIISVFTYVLYELLWTKFIKKK